MEANGLRQKDLAPIFGSESIVSEVLRKKRNLNKTHIEKLSQRFNVSPAVFLKKSKTSGIRCQGERIQVAFPSNLFLRSAAFSCVGRKRRGPQRRRSALRTSHCLTHSDGIGSIR